MKFIKFSSELTNSKEQTTFWEGRGEVNHKLRINL